MPRRILLFITDLEIGGTPTVVRELAIHLSFPGDVVIEVACLSKWGPVADQLHSASISVTALNCTRSWQFPLAVRRLIRLIRDRQYDTVFSFLVHANTVAAAASRLCGGVRWLQSIQTTQALPRWHWRLQKLAHRAADRIVVPSPSTRDVAVERSGIPLDKIDVIPNAVDPDAFPRSEIPRSRPVPYPIGFIGRLDPVKRVDTLIRSMQFLQDLKCPVTLDIFGDGPLRPALTQTVSELSLDSRVRFQGFVARPQEALQQIGALVLASGAEGFGLVLIEAMAAGVPVIANNAPGIRDVIRDGQNGLLFPGDPRSLAEAIAKVIAKSELAEHLIKNGLRDVRERYSWDSVSKHYRKLLMIP